MAECGGVIRWRYSRALTHTGDKSLSGALRGLIASNINQTNEGVGGGAERGCRNESADSATENFIANPQVLQLPRGKTALRAIVNPALGYVLKSGSSKIP